TDHAAVSEEGHGQQRTVASLADERHRVARLALEIGDLDGGAGRRRLPGRAFTDPDSQPTEGVHHIGRDTVVRARYERPRGLVELVDPAGVGAREIDRVRHDAGEDGLDVEAAADRLPDLAERSQLLHRTRQLVRPRLQLLEEADVLDGDDRLIGE